jgi:hypothetical protein
MSLSPQRMIEVGKAGRETISRMFASSQIVDRLVGRYERISEDFRSNPPAPPCGWLPEICRPADVACEPSLRFLDSLPLRGIVAYVLNRCWDSSKV